MTVPPANANFLELLGFFGPRMGFSLLCGALVGLERELKNKAAGIKTNMMICFGACLYTALSVFLAGAFGEGHMGDPARLAAQVVSGIGFIGGGAIIKERGAIHGVTTAAMIWFVAAIGVCIGVGLIPIAVFLTIGTVLALVTVTQIEGRVIGRVSRFTIEIYADEKNGEVRQAINEALERRQITMDDFDSSIRGDLSVFRIHCEGSFQSLKAFLLDLWKIPGVKEARKI